MTGDSGLDPGLSLQTLEGERLPLASLGESGEFLLAFFKASCPTCQFAFPFLDRLAGGALPVYGVSQDDAATTRQFASRFAQSLPLLQDPEESGYRASNAFGVTNVPSLFLIAGGKIAWADSGFTRAGLEMLGVRAGRAVFRPDESVPERRPG